MASNRGPPPISWVAIITVIIVLIIPVRYYPNDATELVDVLNQNGKCIIVPQILPSLSLEYNAEICC